MCLDMKTTAPLNSGAFLIEFTKDSGFIISIAAGKKNTW